jgi:hypothetical protein
VLRGLGWEVLRVWSTDWWVDAPGTADRLCRQLDERLVASRSQRALTPPQAADRAATPTHAGAT